MKVPTYSSKELMYLVEHSDTMAFLSRVYEIFEREFEYYSVLERKTIKIMMACKTMAFSMHKSLRF